MEYCKKTVQKNYNIIKGECQFQTRKKACISDGLLCGCADIEAFFLYQMIHGNEQRVTTKLSLRFAVNIDKKDGEPNLRPPMKTASILS